MKKFFLAPLLYGFSSAVADMSDFQQALKSIDTRNVIDRVRAAVHAVVPNDFAIARDNEGEEGEDCAALQTSYYIGTAIDRSQALTFFLFVEEWKEASFDLNSFFEDMNFDNECELMGGIVETFDVNYSCEENNYDQYLVEGEGEEVKGVLREYRVCRPPVCSDFEYFLSQELMFTFVGSITECEMSIDTDGRGSSLACLEDLEVIYNATDLEGTSITDFLGNDLEYFVQNNCTSFSDEEIRFVCHMQKFKEEQTRVTEACEGGGLGTILPMDIRFDAIDAHISLTRYLQCVPETCTNDEIMVYYDFFLEEVTKETEDVYFHFQKSTINSCDEYDRHRAFIKQYDGKIVDQSCKWLKTVSDFDKNKYCQKNFSFGDYGPAQDVCPVTCCTCKEIGKNLFLKKVDKNEDGFIKIIYKDCNWLKSIPETNRRFHCDKKDASYLGGYPPAADACPETCGTCIDEE